MKQMPAGTYKLKPGAKHSGLKTGEQKQLTAQQATAFSDLFELVSSDEPQLTTAVPPAPESEVPAQPEAKKLEDAPSATQPTEPVETPASAEIVAPPQSSAASLPAEGKPEVAKPKAK